VAFLLKKMVKQCCDFFGNVIEVVAHFESTMGYGYSYGYERAYFTYWQGFVLE
jgi:hypothetical protein